jgi:hypothetical protein
MNTAHSQVNQQFMVRNDFISYSSENTTKYYFPQETDGVPAVFNEEINSKIYYTYGLSVQLDRFISTLH